MNIDKYFRISVIDGALEIIRHRQRYPEVGIDDSIRQLRAGPSHLAGYDYVAAQQLADQLGWDAFCPHMDRVVELRLTLMQLAIRGQPFWAKLAVYGRDKVRNILSDDQAQCLHFAGLLGHLDDDVMKWWDQLAAILRIETAQQKLEIGRSGEHLSLHYEIQRLRNIGILGREPKWMSIEDNSIGYDISSYDYNDEGEIIDIRIEVKSTNTDPIHFIVTSNEWLVAQENPEVYYFHVWNIRQCKLYVLKVETLLSHIPINMGVGKWLQTEIRLDKLSQSSFLSFITFDVNNLQE